MTLGEVISLLYSSVDHQRELAGVVIEESRQVQLTHDGPVVVVRCILGRIDSGGVHIEREGESWDEVMGRR